jgi:hypothetical protein
MPARVTAKAPENTAWMALRRNIFDENSQVEFQRGALAVNVNPRGLIHTDDGPIVVPTFEVDAHFVVVPKDSSLSITAINDVLRGLVPTDYEELTIVRTAGRHQILNREYIPGQLEVHVPTVTVLGGQRSEKVHVGKSSKRALFATPSAVESGAFVFRGTGADSVEVVGPVSLLQTVRLDLYLGEKEAQIGIVNPQEAIALGHKA